MDQRQYSTLMDALSAVPDPRKARGKQYSWLLLLTLICSALGSGERSGHGIANWVAEHATSLLLHLRPARGRLPSEATLRRALRRVDVSALEQRLALYTQPIALAAVSHAAVISEQGEILQGQALDGKAVRGATAHGQPTHLVSLVQHASALTLAQVAVEQLALDITAAPILGFLQGASQNWLLLANLLLIVGLLAVPLVFVPRGKQFAPLLATAIAVGQITPQLREALHDPVVRMVHWYEEISLVVVVLLMVFKPF